MSLSRREFIALTALILEGATLGLSQSAHAESQTPLDLSVLPEQAGERYLQLFPLEKDLPRLKQTLYFQSNGNAKAIKSKLLDDIHADFDQGRTFRHEGWVLSRTEGRLCAYNFLTK